MKLKFAYAGASLLVLSACGTSGDALLALKAMKFNENSKETGFSYEKISGWGNDVTLEGVTFQAPPAALAALAGSGEEDGDADAPPPGANAPAMALAKAASVQLNGLTMKDGKPVFRDMVAKSIAPALPLGPFEMSIGEIALQGFTEPAGAFMASLFTDEGPGEAPPIEQWEFKKASIGGIAVKGSIPGEEGASGGAFDVGFGEITLGDMKGPMLGLVRLAGLKGEVTVPTEMLEVKGVFDFGALDINGINTELYTKPFELGFAQAMNPDVEPDYASLFEDYTSPLEPGFNGYTWTGANVDVSGLKLTTTEMSAKVTRDAEGVVTALSMPRSAIKVTADSSGGMLGAISLMGLAMAGYPEDSVELYVGGAATFDPDKDVTKYTDYNLGVTGLFDVKANLGIIGLQQALPTLMTTLLSSMDTLELMAGSAGDDEDEGEAEDDSGEDADEESDEDSGDEADADADAEEDSGEDSDAEAEAEAEPEMSGETMGMIMQLVMGIMPLQLTDLDLEITDVQLVEMILNQQAIGAGVDVSALRADMAAMVQGSAAMMTEAGVDASIANEAAGAVAAFLGGPGTLRIQLKPAKPLGVMSAMASPLTKESLGFSMTFTPAAPAVN